MLAKPETLADVFFAIVDRNVRHLLWYEDDGVWVAISSQELYRRVLAVAGMLRAWGVKPGDRVAILSENRPEWTIADFAALMIGAVVVPIYPTQTAEQCAYVLRDSEASAVFVSSEAQLRKILPIIPETHIAHLLLMDAPCEPLPATVEQMRQVMAAPPAASQRDPEFDRSARQIMPGQLATLIYTSGTTGTPKGVMLTHGNLASNIAVSLESFSLSDKDSSIAFLPLSHITARHVNFALLYRGITTVYAPAIDQLPRILRRIRPTVFVAVPRVYEKMQDQVQRQVTAGFKRRLYNWAIDVGEHHLGDTLAGRRPRSLAWRIADLLVFSKVRKAMGGRVRVFISGGAPLGRELGLWYAKIGMCIHEGYGLTETSPVIALNNVRGCRLGTVGKPLRNVEVRIAADGEILVRGPSVFQGYWHMIEETRNAFEGDWFKTGDIGRLDDDGFLVVTDRKKDLIKTSGGKFIAPQPIESSLKANPLVGEAAVVGERRRFPAVLIVPAFALLEDWARRQGVMFNSREELVADARVLALYEKIVDQANQKLARFERMKKFLILPEELSIANGTLTPTFKLRRRNLEDRYRESIEMLYAEAAPWEAAKAG